MRALEVRMKVDLVRGTILNLKQVLQALISVLLFVPRALLLLNLHLVRINLVPDLLQGLVELLLSLLILTHEHGLGHGLRLLFRPGSLVMWAHTELTIHRSLLGSSSILIVI